MRCRVSYLWHNMLLDWLTEAMTNQELIDTGKKTMDETDQVIERSKKVLSNSVDIVKLNFCAGFGSWIMM